MDSINSPQVDMTPKDRMEAKDWLIHWLEYAIKSTPKGISKEEIEACWVEAKYRIFGKEE